MKYTKTLLILEIIKLDSGYVKYRSRLYAKDKENLIKLYERLKRQYGK